MRKPVLILLTLLAWVIQPLGVFAASPSPAQTAETMRAGLVQAQVSLLSDLPLAQQALTTVQAAYAGEFAATIRKRAPAADQQIRAGLVGAQQALGQEDAPVFAAARARVWTGILAGSYGVVAQAVEGKDGQTAQQWLAVREFRTATRFARPAADATLAVAGLKNGTVAASDALLAVDADLLDTYQARLNEVLADLVNAEGNGYAMRLAEHAGLAEGYFAILAPAYAQQQGAAALAAAQQAFANLRSRAVQGEAIAPALTAVQTALHTFRAAPLNPEDQTRRAGQLLRYLSLVPVEYARGIVNGKVNRSLEIQEAITFRDGAAAAFADLENLLDALDAQQTAVAAEVLKTLETHLLAAMAQTAIVAPKTLQVEVDQLIATLKVIMPAEWQKVSVSSDFDVIAAMLDQMESAVKAGEYDLAASARLEAYALLEVGPEARLMVFAPVLKARLEELFWNGTGDPKGLAYLISAKAPAGAIKASRAALDASLAEAQKLLSAGSAPTAVATNAGVIVFREGLEAVLILASLLSSLKREEERKYRRPLWIGAIVALGATALTWVVAHNLLMALARYGERLEAIVSLVAIGVLLLITNWFFHKVYWTGWIANFHAHKKRLISGEAGLLFGLMALGFTSIYREGFETVLFLQALVLEGGTTVVLSGVLIALAAVGLIGLVTFKLQSNLPYKKMLIYTGVMIGAVLLIMVGNTVHVLQVVGWLPIHLIHGVSVPVWMGMWFGLFPTWEGVGLQIASAAFVIGSYYWAEYLAHRRRQPVKGVTRPGVERIQPVRAN
ncbi:MAG: FTR1 family protein [Chloroflexota bacterium]|nr:FTR1 family protein [Chloroflexota bacterium]